MERPLADKRPVGPIFNQSDSFGRDFLSGGSDETFKKGDSGVIVAIPSESSVSMREMSDYLEDVVNVLEPYVALDIEDEGELSEGAYVATYTVVEVQDPDVTVGQYQRALLNEIALPSVVSVNVYNKHVR